MLMSDQSWPYNNIIKPAFNDNYYCGMASVPQVDIEVTPAIGIE